MEEITTTELIYAMIAVVLAGIVGGIISWKLIGKKEEERAKECKAMGKDVWIFKINTSTVFITGFCPTFVYAFAPFVSSLIPEYSLFFYSIAFAPAVACMWVLLYAYPLVVIINDSIIMYNYMGFGRAKKYALSELTLEESYGLYYIYLNNKYIKKSRN